MIIVHKKKKDKRLQFKDTLGLLPEKVARKNYMQMYHFHHDYKVIEDQTMGGWFSIKIKISWKNPLKSLSRFVSQTIKDIAKLPAQAMVVVKNVGTVAEDAYDAAKKIAISALPPDLRPLVGQALMTLEKVVTNPVPTVIGIAESATDLAANIVRETVNAGEVVYREVAKPAFKIARNIANETVWQPIHKVADVTILPILPKSVRDKLNEVLDIPDAAFRGKLTDKDVLEGLKATGQIAMIPSKIGLNLANDTINTLKKDAVLGPFLEKLDLYTGGLLSAAQNVAATPDDIYNDRNINWKQKMIDALKIYLAYASASSIAQYAKGVGVSAVGTETGLNQTPIGRTALAVGVAYGGAMASGNLSNLAKDEFIEESGKIVSASAQEAALNEAKKEAIKESVKKGWVDDSTTASLILSAGGKFYSTVGTDKTLMDAMNEVHDKEFQAFVEHEIKKKTGVDVKYWQLVDLYNTDWKKLSEDLNNAMAKMVPTIGTTDGDFLANMGKNFVDEMRRVPANFANIGSNILDELQRTPQNMADLASAIAKEADRTPENVARIATNIANASAKAAQDAATAATKAAQDAAAEAARTPANVATIATNVATETARGAENVATTVVKAGGDIASEVARTPENIINAVSNVSVTAPSVSMPVVSLPTVSLPSIPKVDLSSLDDLIKKYGPDFLNFMQSQFGPNYMNVPYSPDQLQNIEIAFNTKKKSNAPLLVGIFAVLAAGYYATQD